MGSETKTRIYSSGKNSLIIYFLVINVIVLSPFLSNFYVHCVERNLAFTIDPQVEGPKGVLKVENAQVQYPEESELDKADLKDVGRITTPPVVIPASVKQTGTIIFLHGHGQAGNNWSKDLEKVQTPYMKIICPTANTMPLSYYDQTLAMNSWFDFGGKEAPEFNETCNGFEIATNYVHHLIEEEIKNGIPPERIILSGFSQGGALALHSALSFPQKLGGIVTLSSWQPMPKTVGESFKPINKNIPILQCYIGDEYDPSWPYDPSETTANLLRKHVSDNVDMKKYHSQESFVMEELDDMKKFCETHVAPI